MIQSSKRMVLFLFLQVLGFCILPVADARLGPRASDILATAPLARQLEIKEYPVQLEPFHLVYHHHPRRNQNFEGMEEMDVLAATRNYISYVLTQHQPDNFQRLLLYLFIREEDDSLTKVAYSGTAFYATPTTPATRQTVQDTIWLGFLGDNKTDYLLHLTQYSVFDIDSVTLLTVGGSVVGVDSNTGEISAIEPPSPAPDNNNDIANDNSPGAPDTSMSQSVSMSLYLCAIIIPLAVLALIIIWWVVRKLRYDVIWQRPKETDPNGEIWQTSLGLERQFAVPEAVTTTTPSITDHSDELLAAFDSRLLSKKQPQQQQKQPQQQQPQRSTKSKKISSLSNGNVEESSPPEVRPRKSSTSKKHKKRKTEAANNKSHKAVTKTTDKEGEETCKKFSESRSDPPGKKLASTTTSCNNSTKSKLHLQSDDISSPKRTISNKKATESSEADVHKNMPSEISPPQKEAAIPCKKQSKKPAPKNDATNKDMNEPMKKIQATKMSVNDTKDPCPRIESTSKTNQSIQKKRNHPPRRQNQPTT